MSDLERELRARLDDRAGRVESDLAGPELRRLAVERAASRRGRARRAAPVLASAAAVAALGIGAALLITPSDDPRPVQPGGPGPATSAPATPSPPATPTVSARPVVPRPSDSPAMIRPSGAAVPTRSGSLPLQSLLIRPTPPTRGRVSDDRRTSAPRPSVSTPSASTPSAR